MSDYLYGNTRLRAMKSRLFSSDALRFLTKSRDLADFLQQITRSVYREDMEKALVLYSGLNAFNQFLRVHNEKTIHSLCRFYSGKPATMIELILWRYEIHNIKTILRGQAVQEDAAVIQSNLINTGLISKAILNQLVNAQDHWQMINRVITFGLPYAKVFHQPDSILAIESRLEQWYFEETQTKLKKNLPGYKDFLSALDLEADLINLMLAFRFAAEEDTSWETVREHFIQAGNLNKRKLQALLSAENLQDALTRLENSPYFAALRPALPDYTLYENIADLEKRLRQYRLAWYHRLLLRDPLGIGVPLGYMALKQNELRNLSWISRGIYFGIKPETIEGSLEFLQ